MWPWVFFSACPLAFRAHPSVPLPLIALCLLWPPKLNYLRSPDARGLRDGTRRCCASGCNSPSAGAALLWCHWIGKTFSPPWGWNVCVQRCNDNHIISQLRECIPAAQRTGRGLGLLGILAPDIFCWLAVLHSENLTSFCSAWSYLCPSYCSYYSEEVFLGEKNFLS